MTDLEEGRCCSLCAGELFFIGYEMDKKPACVWYAGLDKEGALKFDVKVPLQVCLSFHCIQDRMWGIITLAFGSRKCGIQTALILKVQTCCLPVLKTEHLT